MICLNCKKQFVSIRSTQKFCSRKCHEQDKHRRRYVHRPRKKIARQCVGCGVEFYGGQTAKYCSEVCRHKAAWKQKRVQEIQHCQRCGVEIGYHRGSKWCTACKAKVD